MFVASSLDAAGIDVGVPTVPPQEFRGHGKPEGAEHQVAKAVLFAAGRYQKRAITVLARLRLSAKGQTELMEDLLQAHDAHGHRDEVAGVGVPEIAQALRGGLHQVEIDLFK